MDDGYGEVKETKPNRKRDEKSESLDLIAQSAWIRRRLSIIIAGAEEAASQEEDPHGR